MSIKIVILLIIAFLPAYSQDLSDTISVVQDSLFISDSLAVTDTLAIKDSVIIYDTTIVFSRTLYDNSFEIDRNVFLRTDYRYTGNLIEPFQFSFIKDFGLVGQNNESYIYGAGFNGISYLLDGVLINDRNFNSFDLNLIQSEDIEKIEIIPAPRGFLYGPRNNPSAVNFITRDFIPAQPYSRIKYYQAPFGEAMVDGSFNALVSRNLLLSFDITNRKYDSSYTNTAFSTWQAKVKVKYFFTNNMYLSATYNHTAKTTGLWGGVNTDSIIALGSRLEDLLYEPDFAPVNNTFRKQEDLLNFSSLRFTSVQNKNSRTELTLYHQFKELKTNSPFNIEYDNTSWGLNLNQRVTFKPLSFYTALLYEQNKLEWWYRGTDLGSVVPYIKRTDGFFALAGSVSLNLIENFIPSFFYKFNSISTDFDFNSSLDYYGNGYGIDAVYKPLDRLALYAGYSTFDKSFYEDRKTNVFESGITYKTDNYFLDLRYFRRDNTNINLAPGIPSINPVPFKTGNLSGLGLSANVLYWNMQFETQAAAYFPNSNELYSVPDFQFIGGLYYRGNLFEDNLNLKAGFKFTYTGKINSIIQYLGLIKADPSHKLDFILSGEIQQAAIIYFTLENLLDKQYYITPYYPMPGISLRFGLAWEFLN
jgi:hypothetical protein